jgi:hypothetical protein
MDRIGAQILSIGRWPGSHILWLPGQSSLGPSRHCPNGRPRRCVRHVIALTRVSEHAVLPVYAGCALQAHGRDPIVQYVRRNRRFAIADWEDLRGRGVGLLPESKPSMNQRL